MRQTSDSSLEPPHQQTVRIPVTALKPLRLASVFLLNNNHSHLIPSENDCVRLFHPFLDTTHLPIARLRAMPADLAQTQAWLADMAQLMAAQTPFALVYDPKTL